MVSRALGNMCMTSSSTLVTSPAESGRSTRQGEFGKGSETGRQIHRGRERLSLGGRRKGNTKQGRVHRGRRYTLVYPGDTVEERRIDILSIGSEGRAIHLAKRDEGTQTKGTTSTKKGGGEGGG